jgi:RNA polymerase sigma-70 factor, ECF subfamily
MLPAYAAMRPTAMTDSLTNERISQPEFEAFYSQTARVLHGYLCRLSRDPAIAEEVLQEAYMRMLNAPAMEDRSRKAYLYQTATNLLRDHWRKQKRERENWELNEPAEQHHDLSLPLDVATVFEQLTARDRATLWLAHVEELNHREIAAILGMKENSIKVILFRARARAKDLLEKAGWVAAHEGEEAHEG